RGRGSARPARRAVLRSLPRRGRSVRAARRLDLDPDDALVRRHGRPRERVRRQRPARPAAALGRLPAGQRRPALEALARGAESDRLSAGVGGCAGGWVAVRLRDGSWDGYEDFATFADLLARLTSAAAIGVDIPIGLPLSYPRPADVAARKFVGPRGSSVFPT